jgi:hypothetical protein
MLNRKPTPQHRVLQLKGPDSLFIILNNFFLFFFQIIFNIFPENNEWVVVKLHPAHWALYGRLEPRRDTLLVEQVLTLEPPIKPSHLVKTYYTYMCIVSV